MRLEKSGYLWTDACALLGEKETSLGQPHLLGLLSGEGLLPLPFIFEGGPGGPYSVPSPLSSNPSTMHWLLYPRGSGLERLPAPWYSGQHGPIRCFCVNLKKVPALSRQSRYPHPLPADQLIPVCQLERGGPPGVWRGEQGMGKLPVPTCPFGRKTLCCAQPAHLDAVAPACPLGSL